ncbi:MAG: hypothetical protein P4L90_25895 [Rhodopila sp.]|nr:hypothetical protein [Rhodopila sp.]
MSKLLTFKVEIQADDDAPAAKIKDVIRDALRGLGAVTVPPDPVEGQPALDGECSVFFGGTGVKTFVVRASGAKTARSKP